MASRSELVSVQEARWKTTSKVEKAGNDETEDWGRFWAILNCELQRSLSPSLRGARSDSNCQLNTKRESWPSKPIFPRQVFM